MYYGKLKIILYMFKKKKKNFYSLFFSNYKLPVQIQYLNICYIKNYILSFCNCSLSFYDIMLL